MGVELSCFKVFLKNFSFFRNLFETSTLFYTEAQKGGRKSRYYMVHTLKKTKKWCTIVKKHVQYIAHKEAELLKEKEEK